MPIEFGALTAYCSVGVGNKGRGLETDNKQRPNSKMKGEWGYHHPIYFRTGTVFHSLVGNKRGFSYGNSGYIKDRNLCVIQEIKMTMHSAASWIYRVPLLFIALISIDHKNVRCTRTDLKCDFIMKQINDSTILCSYSMSGDSIYLALVISIRKFRRKIHLVM